MKAIQYTPSHENKKETKLEKVTEPETPKSILKIRKNFGIYE